MKTVYSLNDKDYFECGSGNILKIKRIVNIVMEEQKLNENRDKDFFTLYVGTKEEFFPNIFVDDIIENLRQQAFQEIDDENFLSDIEEDEKEMIHSIVTLGETSAKEVMTPRTSMLAFEGAKTINEVWDEIIDNGFSRIPIYEETIDNIIGILVSANASKRGKLVKSLLATFK